MCFVEIVGRDIEHLKDLNTRARVEVRFLSKADVSRMLAALASCDAVSLRGRYVTKASHQAFLESQPQDAQLLRDLHVAVGDAIQVSDSFGVARPVLEALQSKRLAAPPCADTLFGGAHTAVPEPLQAPPWEQCEDTRAWLQAQVGRMDGAQRAAFDATLIRPVSLIQGPPGACTGAALLRLPAHRTYLTDFVALL